jgi:hypothetical protein
MSTTPNGAGSVMAVARPSGTTQATAGTCTITIDEIPAGQLGEFSIGQSSDSPYDVSGKPTGRTTFAGTYKARVCKGTGDNYTVVLSPEEKAWTAEWKGLSGATESEPLRTVSPVSTPIALPTSTVSQQPSRRPVQSGDWVCSGDVCPGRECP